MTKKQATRKTQVIRVLLAVGTVTSLFFVPWLLVKAWILPLPNTIQEQLDEAIGHGLDGVIVYVDKAGEPPASYGSGWKNKENQIKADPNALFKIASISKLYTALAVTKLVREGRLSLNKTPADYLPELSGRIANAEKATLRLMVQHKSGIPNFTDTPNFWASPTQSTEESLALIHDLPASFEPGKGYEYSNTNYLLLKAIMGKVLGHDYFQFVRERVLIPLNLKNTYESITKVDLDDVMSGYHVGYSHDLKANDHGMVATAEDVGKFLRALNDGSAFDEGEQEIYSSIYEYKHSGWVPGYQSFAEYHQDTDAVVVLFNNTTDPKLYLWNLSQIVYSRVVKIVGRENN